MKLRCPDPGLKIEEILFSYNYTFIVKRKYSPVPNCGGGGGGGRSFAFFENVTTLGHLITPFWNYEIFPPLLNKNLT